MRRAQSRVRPANSPALRLCGPPHSLKNWLFAGSDEGAERACILYSLIASCKLHGVNPFDYLRDVLVRVGDHPARDGDAPDLVENVK
jgi:transposase